MNLISELQDTQAKKERNGGEISEFTNYNGEMVNTFFSEIAIKREINKDKSYLKILTNMTDN